jgi:uncharacterized protein (DUF58 family)
MNKLRASLPEITRLTKSREGVLRVGLEGAPTGELVLAVGLPLEITSPNDRITAIPPTNDGAPFWVEWTCMGSKRGLFQAGPIYIEKVSPWGFWDSRITVETHGEIRVYPNILQERKSLAALFLNRGNIGIHAQRQVGKGRELERLREYAPGDLYEDISWKATAKRGRPISKVHQVERTQEVYVLLDASRLSGREVTTSSAAKPTTPKEIVVTQLERFISTAMILGLVAERQGDLFGVAAFDEHVRAFVRARNGKNHYSACRDALYSLEPSCSNPDYGELFSFIRLRLRRRALLILLTNLDDPLLAEQFARNVDLLSGHHLVLVNMLQEPEVRPLFSGPAIEHEDEAYSRLAGHIQWKDLQELEKTLNRRGVRFALLNHETMTTQVVSQYINVKQRQTL